MALMALSRKAERSTARFGETLIPYAIVRSRRRRIVSIAVDARAGYLETTKKASSRRKQQYGGLRGCTRKCTWSVGKLVCSIGPIRPPLPAGRPWAAGNEPRRWRTANQTFLLGGSALILSSKDFGAERLGSARTPISTASPRVLD